MEDPRLGLPSASSFVITASCPGSKALIQGLPPIVQEPDEMALRGERIHRAWQTGNTLPLSEDELDDYNATLQIAKTVEDEWKDQLMVVECQEAREERLWLHSATGEPVASGQFDKALFVPNDCALILDLKSGWAKDLTPAELSWQLRLLAILFCGKYGVKRVRVAFVTPKKFRKKQDVVDYDFTALQRSLQMAVQALWEADQPNAPRRPGKHCDWCPGKGWCAENAAWASLPAHIAKSPLEAVQYLNLNELLSVHEQSRVIVKVLDAIKERIKTFDDDELLNAGWRKTKGRTLDQIVDTANAYTNMHKELSLRSEDHYVSGKLWGAVELKKGKLIEITHALIGGSRKDAEALVKKTIEPYVEHKVSEGSLEKI